MTVIQQYIFTYSNCLLLNFILSSALQNTTLFTSVSTASTSMECRHYAQYIIQIVTIVVVNIIIIVVVVVDIIVVIVIVIVVVIITTTTFIIVVVVVIVIFVIIITTTTFVIVIITITTFVIVIIIMCSLTTRTSELKNSVPFKYRIMYHM